MDVMELLDELEELIEKHRIFSKKSDILDVIKEIRLGLPDEIKQAQWIKEEKQKILYDAKRESEEIILNADSKVKELIENSNIKEEAEILAEKIIKDAEEEAESIIGNAFEYSDGIFEVIERKLGEFQDTMSKNRQAIKKMNEKRR